MAKTKTRKKGMKPGIYNAMIDGVVDHGDGTVTVKMTLIGKGFKYTERLTTVPKLSDPEAGHVRYYILCSKLNIFTAIGADNIHHASNKATKLFGPHWTSLMTDTNHNSFILREWTSCTVKEFNELIKTLRN